MTGREHCELYAAIKGVPKKSVKEAAAACLAEVGLSPEDSDRLSSEYSGGMKRRLSLACALIGQPQIVFLDECTTVRPCFFLDFSIAIVIISSSNTTLYSFASNGRASILLLVVKSGK